MKRTDWIDRKKIFYERWSFEEVSSFVGLFFILSNDDTNFYIEINIGVQHQDNTKTKYNTNYHNKQQKENNQTTRLQKDWGNKQTSKEIRTLIETMADVINKKFQGKELLIVGILMVWTHSMCSIWFVCEGWSVVWAGSSSWS